MKKNLKKLLLALFLLRRLIPFNYYFLAEAAGGGSSKHSIHAETIIIVDVTKKWMPLPIAARSIFDSTKSTCNASLLPRRTIN